MAFRCFFLPLAIVLVTILSGVKVVAQPVTDAYGNVGIGTFAPHSSASLDLFSNNRGVLIPRLSTAQRDAILLPAHALLIYNTNDSTFQFNVGDEQQPVWHSFVVTNQNGDLLAPISSWCSLVWRA